MGNHSSIKCRATLAVLAFALGGCALLTDPIPEQERAAAVPPEEAPIQAEPTEDVVAGEPTEQVALQPEAPLRYIVKKGDTLWHIASRFLRDPWQWPEVWYVNPKVQNPHLIFPGDELYLYFVDGRPRIGVAGVEPEPGATITPGGVEPTLPPAGEAALAPRVRELPLDQAIYAIPLDAIRGFLRGPRLIDEEELDDAPYIVDFEDEHLIAGNDTIAYALELEDTRYAQYQIVRRGKEYRDPDDNDVIGYEVLPVADSEVRAFGDPATIYLRRSDMEARKGDYLLPVEQDPLSLRFVPHAPDRDVDGRIISVHGGLSLIGQYQIVAINRGTEHGMEPGHVLSVWKTGRRTKDPYSFFGSRVELPDVRAGTAMVFKTGPRLSYALIMAAERPIHILDRVERPELAR